MAPMAHDQSPFESDDEISRQPRDLVLMKDILKPDTLEQTFLLEDAIFYRDGDAQKEPANILLTLNPDAAKTTITVEGIFVADKDQVQFLKHGKKARKDFAFGNIAKYPVAFTQVRVYSFGDGPVTIWILHQNNWYEIRPTSPRYRPVFKDMTNTVKLYYLAEDFYSKETTERKEKLNLEPSSFNEPFEIIRQFCEGYSGEGAHFSYVIQLIRRSTRFFAETAAREGFVAKGHLFFDWVAAGAPTADYDGGYQIPAIDGLVPPILEEGFWKDNETPPPEEVIPPVQPLFHDTMDIDGDSEDESRNGKPPDNYRGSYSSPDFPNGIVGRTFDVNTWVDLFHIILAHSCSYSDCKPSDVDLPHIHTRVYQEFSFYGPVNARQLSFVHQDELKRTLPAKYSQIHRILAKGLSDESNHYTKTQYREEFREIMAGKKTFKPRGTRRTTTVSRPSRKAVDEEFSYDAPAAVTSGVATFVAPKINLNVRPGVKRSTYGTLMGEWAGI